MKWPFADPPNTAVFTTNGILDRQEWIYLVTHDSEDGAWQFHHARDNELRTTEAVVVALHRILEIDPAVAKLADLPLGWQAWRESKDAEWIRAPQSE